MIRRPPRSPLFPHPPLSRSDNMFSDNRLCVELVKSLLEQCNLFGYGQIKQGWYPAGTLMSVYSQRSEEHTSELQSRQYLVCRLLLEKKKTTEYSSLICTRRV